MVSTSQQGNTNITLQFDLNRDINAAARDVQAAINAARGQLPSDLPGQPGYWKVNPADSPIMLLAMTSDNVLLPEVYRRRGFGDRAKIAPDSGHRRSVYRRRRQARRARAGQSRD